jgi:hypothetical protein
MPKAKNILAKTKMKREAKLEKLKSEIGITSLLSLYVLAQRNKIKKIFIVFGFFLYIQAEYNRFSF